MALIYVLHADADRDFVEKRLVRPLPALGYDRWLTMPSAEARDANGRAAGPYDAAVPVLTVVSRAAAASAGVRAAAAALLRQPLLVVAVQIDGTSAGEIAPALEQAPLLDARTATVSEVAAGMQELGRLLAELLPAAPPARTSSARLRQTGTAIEWNEEVFSGFLSQALRRHDHTRADELLAAFAQHIDSRLYPYPPTHAAGDLSQLCQDRQFGLMRRYAELALASGTDDYTVRRLYGQALIELREYARAIEVLHQIVREAAGTHVESVEARGLLGRAFKQQYVNDPGAPGAANLLALAIDAYESVFRENADHTWHGVNAATCRTRAARDGVAGGDRGRAHDLARDVLIVLEQREKRQGLDMWDYATRIEALVLLNEYDEADRALTAYLAHPRMHAFQVSSTHRQFEQVLQLQRDPHGRKLVDRLWHSVERYRAPAARAPILAQGRRGPLLVRVTDPSWQPVDVPDLVVQARLGTVIAVEGSSETVRALLQDPLVKTVEESRRSGARVECSRSLPFIRAANPYQHALGPFEERGDAALVAIIDDGIDVLHGAFLDAGGASRIAGIWDQRDATGPPPPGFALGTYHDAAAIAGYVASLAVPDGLGRNKDGHGTHVASIAAGRAVGAFAGGVAPEARILVVIADSQHEIGYSHEHLMALAFIEKAAADLGLPVVVNVSLGMNAGAHDGKSMLEAAFDEFCNGWTHPGRVIVKSAGNERDKNGHALVVVAQMAADQLSWERQPDPFWQRERLELWWSAFDTFRFRLIAPKRDGEAPGEETARQSDWVEPSRLEVSGVLANGGPFTMRMVTLHVDNGDNQLIVEIGDGATLIRSGVWQLEIESLEVKAGGEIHAWIERGGGLPSFFTDHLSEDMTLSIPGTAHNVITVAAVDASVPLKVGTFSSYGPTRDKRHKPDVAAPGVHVIAARGGTADEAMPEDGTSMAAPHVAGAVALVLSRANKSGRKPWPAASQIASVLRQKTMNPHPWDKAQGYGVVDVARLLAAF